MRLRVRHVSRDGSRLKGEAILHAKNPKAGAWAFANENYIASGERIDVMMMHGDDFLNYEVVASRIDEGGCRVRFYRHE